MPATAAARFAPRRAPAGPPPQARPAGPDRPTAPAAAPPEAAAPGQGAPGSAAWLAERHARYRRPAPPEPDPPSLADGLEPEELPAFEALRRAFAARLVPADAGERLLVDAIAACHFRRARLDALEARLTRALLDGRPAAGLPSLAALARMRSALDKEQSRLQRDLARLYELRPEPIRYPGLNPARLRWLAERIEEGRVQPWRPPAEPTAVEAKGPTAPPVSPPAEPTAAVAQPQPAEGAAASQAAAAAREAACAPVRHEAPERQAGSEEAAASAAAGAAGAAARRAAGPSLGAPAAARTSPARPGSGSSMPRSSCSRPPASSG